MSQFHCPKGKKSGKGKQTSKQLHSSYTVQRSWISLGATANDVSLLIIAQLLTYNKNRSIFLYTCPETMCGVLPVCLKVPLFNREISWPFAERVKQLWTRVSGFIIFGHLASSQLSGNPNCWEVRHTRKKFHCKCEFCHKAWKLTIHKFFTWLWIRCT